MGKIPLLVCSMLALSSAAVQAQGPSGLHILGSGGPMTGESGGNLGAGVGYALSPAVSVVADLRYTNVPYESGPNDVGGYFESAGRELLYTLWLLKISGYGSRRVSPYGVAGIGVAWFWRDQQGSFEAMDDFGGALALGGGASMRVSPQMKLFAEFRLMIAAVTREWGLEGPLMIGVMFWP